MNRWTERGVERRIKMYTDELMDDWIEQRREMDGDDM